MTIDGDYLPCERVPESEHLRIGNIEDGFDLVKIRQLLAHWVDFNKDQCRHCWCLHTCQAGCWSNVTDGSKTTGDHKKAACAQYRKDTHKLLVDYCSVLENNPNALDYMKDITIE